MSTDLWDCEGVARIYISLFRVSLFVARVTKGGSLKREMSSDLRFTVLLFLFSVRKLIALGNNQIRDV